MTVDPMRARNKSVEIDEDANISIEIRAEVDKWETKFDATAAWSIKHFDFKPCGLDMGTKHIHVGLRGLQTKITPGAAADGSWSDDDYDMVDDLLETATAYIQTRKDETAQYIDVLMNVIDKLQAKYTPTYIAVGGLIALEEGYAEAIALFTNVTDIHCTSGDIGSMCQGMNHLSQLYMAAAKIQPRFDEKLERIANASKGVFTKSPLKNLFRAVEKTVMKHSQDPTLGRADNVYDIVRCMIEYKTMEDMMAGVRALEECEDVTVLRVKDRFSAPTPGGWMDVMISVEIKGDENKHVCEIQFVHQSLLAVRKGMGGHAEYAVYRSAAELLEVHGGGAGGAGGEEKGCADDGGEECKGEDIAKGTVTCVVERATRSASVEFEL